MKSFGTGLVWQNDKKKVNWTRPVWILHSCSPLIILSGLSAMPENWLVVAKCINHYKHSFIRIPKIPMPLSDIHYYRYFGGLIPR